MKKISKLLMLSGVVIPTIAIASTITSCGSKPTPDPTDYVGSINGQGWKGWESGELSLALHEPSNGQQMGTAFIDSQTNYKAKDFVIPTRVSYGSKIYLVIGFVEEGGFYECTGLTGKLTIPNSVTSISSSVFYGCTGLTGRLTIPDSVTSIGYSAFEGCTGLTGDLTIPYRVTSIGYKSFNGCSGLTGVTFPHSVASIGSSAFEGCRSLAKKLIIPNNVTSIGRDVFKGCAPSAFDIKHVSSGTIFYSYGVIEGAPICFGFNAVTKPSEGLIIQSGTRLIADGAFEGCTGLTGVTFPDSLTNINNNAFYQCTGLTNKLIIPNSVTTIGNYAFQGCTGCLEAEVVGVGTVYYSWDDNQHTKVFFGSNFEEQKPTGALTIKPNTRFIVNGACQFCDGLTGELSIPDSVTSIGDDAFNNNKYTSIVCNFPSEPSNINNAAFSHLPTTGTVKNIAPSGSTYSSANLLLFLKTKGLASKWTVEE